MGKNKVLLFVLNSKYIHSALAPWCLLAGIGAYSRNISAQVAEGTINENIEAVAKRIIDKAPHILGLSCYIWNITQTFTLINMVKAALPNVVIICGGPEVSYNPETVLNNHSNIDFIISGEGEKPFALLAQAIFDKTDTHSIQGVCYKSGETVVVSPLYISSQIQPTPYCKEYFDALKGRITYIEGSRGCPYNCAFCLSGQCGSKVQYYPTQRTKDELLLLANSGTQTIKFVDRTFNANPKRAKELFRFILDNYGSKIPQGVCIHFEVAGDILDDEELYLLSQMPTGAVQLEIGLQSFNEKTLSAINRKTNTEKLKKNIAALTVMKNMHIHIDLIAGLPYEDIKSFEQSFNTAFALQPNMLQLGFLKVLWGSAIGDNPENFGCQYSQKPPYQVINTTWLSHEDMKTLHTMEDATERLYNSGRFCQTIKYVLSASGLSPYQMFKGFGDFCSNYVLENISLNDYTELVFNGMNMLLKADDQQLLRDKMICDRLSTIADSKLPPVLRVPDQRYKQIKNYMAAHNAPPLPGVKRCMAILYFSGRVVYADYKDKDPVSGKYKLNYIALNDIFP